MDFAFPWPYSQGEWLAWSAAVLTVLIGLVGLAAPRLILRALGLPAAERQPAGLAASRAQIGGFCIGIGAAAVLFAQPLIYLTLGLAWALAAFGHLLSLALDGGGSRGLIALFVAVALSALPLAFSFGFVP